MKKAVFLLLIIPAIISCGSSDQKTGNTALAPTDNARPGVDSANATSMQWIDSTSQDLGSIKEGTVVEVTYRFKNTGDKNLVIESVEPSCGCTVPEKPEKPIPPGGEDVIRAKFNSQGRPGVNNKSIMVTTNTLPERRHQLQFKVEVTN